MISFKMAMPLPASLSAALAADLVELGFVFRLRRIGEVLVEPPPEGARP
jgi:hypothetical protein